MSVIDGTQTKKRNRFYTSEFAETINWVSVRRELPEPMKTVLLKMVSPALGTIQGHYDGRGFRFYGEGKKPFGEPAAVDRVAYWTEMPKGEED